MRRPKSWTRAAVLAALVVLSLVGFTACHQTIPSGGSPGAPTGTTGANVPSPTPTSAQGCASQSHLKPGASEEEKITSAGVERSYLISLPAEYLPGRPTPVVLAFHGLGQSAGSMAQLAHFSSEPAIAIYPQGLPGKFGYAWQGADYVVKGVDDVRFTSDVLNEVERHYCVDTSRIYAAGMSNGGGFVSLLACHLDSRIAAFASVSGAYYEGTRSGCADSKPVPILEIHGSADPVMHFAGGIGRGGAYLSVADYLAGWVGKNHCASPPQVSRVSAAVELQRWERQCAGTNDVVHYTILGGGHVWPTKELKTTDVLWHFFLQHRI